MISIALACQPDILLADEPTTALDATVQMQILLLLRKLQQLMGMSVIFVTHDIAVAAESADHVAVMYAGMIVGNGVGRGGPADAQASLHARALGIPPPRRQGEDSRSR